MLSILCSQVHWCNKKFLSIKNDARKELTENHIHTNLPLRKRVINPQQVLVFAHASLQVLPDPEHQQKTARSRRTELHGESFMVSPHGQLLNFSLRRSCWVGVEVSCSGCMKSGEISQFFVPQSVPCAFRHFKSPLSFSRSPLPLAHQLGKSVCARVVWSRFMKLCPQVPKEKLIVQSSMVCVVGSEFSSRCELGRMPVACRDGGKPQLKYLNNNFRTL